MAEMYGGDEINAAVIDTGAMWTRVGLAGGLSPIVTLPTSYARTGKERKFGDVPLLVPKPSKEVENPVFDSKIGDFDAVEGLWKLGLEECGLDPKELPLLFTEQLWAPESQRRAILELALEKFESPATYIAKSPVCSLFSAGRSSGLVVDAGHQTVGVAAVVDGLVLYKPSRRSRKAGQYLDKEVLRLLGADPVPSFRVGGRNPFVERAVEATPSFTQYHANKVVQDFKESMVQVGTPEAGEPAVRSYEFPDGRTVEYGADRQALGDALFANDDEEASMVDEKPSSEWSGLGVSSLVIEAIKACDVDIRANLANNIVVTGGTSLTHKFTERLNTDLTNAFPGLKVRVHAPGNFTERKNSAWIGGSILGSLGTFHQMWVSKKEYDEVGADQLIEKRFG